jgi:hypothetical protein
MYHICSLVQMNFQLFYRNKLYLAGIARVGIVSGWLLKRLRWVGPMTMAIENTFSAIETLAPLALKLLMQVNRPNVVGCIVLGGESFQAKVAGNSRGVALLVGGQVVFGGERFWADVALEGPAEEVRADVVLEAALGADVSLAQVARERLFAVHHLAGFSRGWLFLGGGRLANAL